MPTLSPLFLEQEICLKLTPHGFGYTRKPEHGVAWIDMEIEIEANTLGDWQISEIRFLKANSTHKYQEWERPEGSMLPYLRGWLYQNFADELQSHVDVNLMPASLAENSDRVYDERHSG